LFIYAGVKIMILLINGVMLPKKETKIIRIFLLLQQAYFCCKIVAKLMKN